MAKGLHKRIVKLEQRVNDMQIEMIQLRTIIGLQRDMLRRYMKKKKRR